MLDRQQLHISRKHRCCISFSNAKSLMMVMMIMKMMMMMMMMVTIMAIMI